MKKRIMSAIMAVMIVSVFTISCFATSSTATSSTNTNYPFPNPTTLIGSNEYLLFLFNSNQYCLITYDTSKTLYLQRATSGGSQYKYTTQLNQLTSGRNSMYKFYFYSNGSWVEQTGDTFFMDANGIIPNYFYCSKQVGVYEYNGTPQSGNFFYINPFPVPPKPLVTPQLLAPITQGISSQASVLLGVGLVLLSIILGVSLIPRVLRSLASSR